MYNIKDNIIYNKKYLIILSKMSENLFEAFDYTFGNTIVMDNNIDNITRIKDFINNSNFKTLVFVDYQVENEEVINNLIKKHEIKLVYTKALGALSDEFLKYTFNNLYNLYENGTASEIAFLDKGLYETFKHKGENVKYIKLDIEKNKNASKEFDKNVVGLLNDEHNPRHSFYNELSAVKLSNKFIAKLPKPCKTTKNFLKLFNIDYNVVKNSELINNNEINLYVNFTDNDDTVFLRSMDNNVPCIMGNTELLDNYKKLKDYLVMDSDDDIDEIKDRMNLVSKNREAILKAYEKFREDYSKEAAKLAKEFLGTTKKIIKEEKYEKLLSVIVPVYNTEKFIANTLDSIIDAAIDNMEIIVINDGSKDDSEKIIKEYVKDFPELIRYIKQDNHGLGNVRNVGLKEAKGKYIASIDSDDTININFFADAVEYLENNIDIVVYDWQSITNDDTYPTQAIDWVFNKNEYSKYEGLLYTTIMPSACNKIVKRSLYDELNIKYIEDKFEDLSTTPFILLRAESIKYINKPYYEYYIRSNSIMRTTPGYSMIDVLKLVEERLNKYKEYLNVNIDDFKYYTYSWRIEELIINQLYTIDEKEISNVTEYINKNLKETLLDIFNNPKYKRLLNDLKDEDKKYIEERNKAFEENKLDKYIKKARKENNYFKLTPAIIYYGYKEEYNS